MYVYIHTYIYIYVKYLYIPPKKCTKKKIRDAKKASPNIWQEKKINLPQKTLPFRGANFEDWLWFEKIASQVYYHGKPRETFMALGVIFPHILEV